MQKNNQTFYWSDLIMMQNLRCLIFKRQLKKLRRSFLLNTRFAALHKKYYGFLCVCKAAFTWKFGHSSFQRIFLDARCGNC